MATIVLRAGKGSPLTNAEVDANFTNLNTAVVDAAVTASWTSVSGKPATLAGYGITDAQALDADLTAIAGLAGTSGFLKKTAANTWALDTSTYLTGITSGQVTTALGFTPYNATNPAGYTTNTGTVTSVAVSVPTGLSVTGSPITTSGSIAISLAAGYSIPTTAKQTTWDTASSERRQWDGDSTNLVAATARTSLGLVIGTNVQAWDADLDAIAALSATTGFLKKTAANTWALDTATYLTGNQSISYTGDATGSGTTSVALTLANSGVTAGTYPKVTVDAKGRVTAGAALVAGDVPTLNQSTTGNAATATVLQTARTINGVSFNGSANVTVTTAGTGVGVSGTAVSIAAAYSPNTSTELATAVDLNTLQTAGFYYQTANADAAAGFNYPIAQAGSLFIQKSAGVTQQYQTYGTTDTELYFRSLDSSVWGGWRRVLTSANYNSFSPTLTGTGASGTWGISITGNAATVTNGLVSTGSYADPAWLTSVNYSKLTGTAPTWNQSTTGNAATATALQTARTIGGVSFNGTANINLPGVNAVGNQNTTGTAAGLTDDSSWMKSRGSVAQASVDTATSNGFYTQSNAGDSQGLLVFNAGGSLGPLQMTFTYGGLFQFRNKTDSATWTAWKTALTSANYTSYSPTLTGTGASGTWGISITGNAATATKLATARTIGGVSFDGTANINLPGVNAAGNQSTTGNATTATTLQTARTINGVSFNGSANITVADATKLPLAGGTLTGKVITSGNDTARLFESTNSSAANAVQFYVQHDMSEVDIGNASGVLNLIGGGGVTIGGSTAVTAANYNSYAPSLVGGGASGTWTINVTGTAAGLTGTPSLGYSVSGQNIGFVGQGGPQITNQSGGAAMMSFHREGQYAINFGLNSDNVLCTGGWSRGGTHVVVDTGNIGNYAVLPTGSTMSGNLNIRNVSPTLYLQDTDNISAMLHCNGSKVYILRGSGADSTTWTALNGEWPVYWDLTTNATRFGGAVHAVGTITTNYGFNSDSDERIKGNWTALSNDFVERLAIVKCGTYDRIDIKIGKRQIGVSAQSLQALMPEAVGYNEEEDRYSVNYGNAALSSAVELAKRVVMQSTEIDDLKTRIVKLEFLISKLIGDDR